MFRFILMMLFAVALSSPALAATAAASGVTIDLTGIATTLIAGIFAVLGVVVPLMINKHVTDATAKATLATAVKNSLGALAQAATTTVSTFKPAVTIPGVPATLQPGVDYVLANAGAEAARFGITPVTIAAKIDAQLGLVKIAASVAPVVPAPAAPPVVGT
jgi:hypothetical protein